MKIGIYGGSFDPIHLGHMEVAKVALKSGLVNRIMFVPTYNPKHKKLETSFHNRCVMVNMAISGHPDYVISYNEYEIYKQKMNAADLKPNVYTYDVLNYLKEIYPDDEFKFIMGSDSWDNFHNWYKADEVLNMTKFIVVDRNESFQIRHDGPVTFLPIKDRLDISSTKIRNAIKCINREVLIYYLDCKKGETNND